MDTISKVAIKTLGSAMPAQIAAIIQARTGSTRFPGKVLHPLAGKPLLEHIIKRIQQVPIIRQTVVALPEGSKEDPLEDLAKKCGATVARGPEEDVLQRFIIAGDQIAAQHIIRICSDCPLLDIPLLAALAETHLKEDADYAFVQEPYPLGVSAEAARLDSLKQIASLTTQAKYREHVTTYFHEHPADFKIARIDPPDYLKGKDFRLTVDTDLDMQVIEILYNELYDPASGLVDLPAAIAYLESRPETARLNANVAQKDWRLQK